MKSKPNIRNQFGFTNEEMAMALGVSLSVWSMFELGLRSLPTRSYELLAEMLQHAESFATSAKGADRPEHLKRKQQHFENRLRENEFQQLKLARKIEAAAKKIEMAERKRHTAEFLIARAAGKTNHEPEFFKRIATRADKKLTIDNHLVLINYQTDHEILALENRVLQSKLRNLFESIASAGKDT